MVSPIFNPVIFVRGDEKESATIWKSLKIDYVRLPGELVAFGMAEES